MKRISHYSKPAALALAVGLAGCAATGEGSPQDTAEDGLLPLAISWGVAGDGYGELDWKASRDKGNIRFRLHDRDRDSGVSTTFVNRCYGHWEAQEVFSHESAAAVAGTWRVHCASGRIAEGRFSADESGNGRGEGFDRNGRLVRLAFGTPTSEQEPAPAEQ